MQSPKRLRASTRTHPSVEYLSAELAHEGLAAQRACPPSERRRMALFTRKRGTDHAFMPFNAETQWSAFFENTLGQLMDEHLVDVATVCNSARLARRVLTQHEGHSLTYEHVLALRTPYTFVSDMVIDYFMHLCNQAQTGLQEHRARGCRTAFYTSTSFLQCILTRMRHNDSRSTSARESFCRGIDRQSRRIAAVKNALHRGQPQEENQQQQPSSVISTPLYKMDFLYVPFNVGHEHFVLFVVDMRRQEIALFDSLDDSHERNTYQHGNRRQYRTTRPAQTSESSGEECSTGVGRGGLARVVNHWTKYPALPDMQARYPEINIAYHALVSFLHTYRRVCRHDYPHDIPHYAYLSNPPIFHGYYKHYGACQTGADCSIYVILNCMFGGPAFRRWNHARASSVAGAAGGGGDTSPFEAGPPDFSHFSICSISKSSMLRRFLALLCFHPRVFSLDPTDAELWDPSELLIWNDFAHQPSKQSGAGVAEEGDDSSEGLGDYPPPNTAPYNLACRRIYHTPTMFVPHRVHHAVEGVPPASAATRPLLFSDTRLRFGSSILINTKHLRAVSSFRAAASAHRSHDLLARFRYVHSPASYSRDFEQARYLLYLQDVRGRLESHLQESQRRAALDSYAFLPSPYIENSVRVHCSATLKTPIAWSFMKGAQALRYEGTKRIRLVLVGTQGLVSPVHLFKRLYNMIQARMEGDATIVDVIYVHADGGDLANFDHTFPDMHIRPRTRTITNPVYMLSAPELFEPPRGSSRTYLQRSRLCTKNLMCAMSDLLYLDRHLRPDSVTHDTASSSASSLHIHLFDGVSDDPTTGREALRHHLLSNRIGASPSTIITDTYIMKAIPSRDPETDAIVHTIIECAGGDTAAMPSHVHLYSTPDTCGCIYVQTTRDAGVHASTFGQTLERMKRDQIIQKVTDARLNKRDPKLDAKIRYLRETPLGCMGFWMTREECSRQGNHADHSREDYQDAQRNFVRTATLLRALHQRLAHPPAGGTTRDPHVR